MAGRGKAKVSEQFLIDNVLIRPDSSGLAKGTTLNHPSRHSQSTTLGMDLGISKIPVYLSRRLITFSPGAF